MRSIKKIMCSVILVMVTALIFDVFTRFLYVPCDSVNYFRQRDFKEQDGKIEVALCGTSIAKDGFNPSVFDKQLGMNSFNFGTSAQNVEHTYYLLQQLIKNNPLQVVYLNVSTETVAKRESSFDAKATIVDNYFHPLTKLKNFFNIYDMDEYERAMFYTYSLEDSSIAAVNTVRKNVLGKMKQELLLQRKPKSYAGKGHTAYQHIYDGTMPEKKYIKKKALMKRNWMAGGWII